MGAVQPQSTRQLILEVKNSDQDFEWYPTTDEIIQTIKHDIEVVGGQGSVSVLDCGAGDGRVLKALAGSKKYAIERSRPLLDAMDRNIFIVGTDFMAQTLIDKKVDCVFSNPPYSEYGHWATRIIREANAAMVYLVIPDRWSQSRQILQAIEDRQAKASILGEFDFLNADRQARCHVNIVKVDLGGWSHRYRSGAPSIDPFELWFEENFKIGAPSESRTAHEFNSARKDSLRDVLAGELVEGGGLAVVLERLYQSESQKLVETYKKLESIDADLLDEMDINIKGVRESLKLKYESLKDRYWKELFDNLGKVTSRLAKQSRKTMLDTLTAHTHVDFSVQNIYGVLGWVCKNANLYFDTQLVRVVEQVTGAANITLYKSNERTFGREEWRYNRKPEDLERYALEYRIIMDGWYGLEQSEYAYKYKSGLSESGGDVINDLRTVASNLGFEVTGQLAAHDFTWESGRKHEFLCKNIRTGDTEVLFTAKAFKNGNLHFQMNQEFIMRLNVEFGRLKGWVKSAQDVAAEMDIPAEVAAQAFGSNLQLETTLRLGCDI